MRIILSTGTLHTYPLEEIFFVAKEAGFDGLELVLNKQICEKSISSSLPRLFLMLPVYSLHAPFMRYKGWGGGGRSLLRTVELAMEFSIPLVNFHPPCWVNLEIGFWHWLKGIKDFQEEVGRDNVIVTIENMPLLGGELRFNGYIWGRTRNLLQFITERNLYLTFDCTHMGTHKADFIDDFSAFYATGRIKNIHLSDYGHGGEHLLPGRGELPLTRFLLQLGRFNYKGLLTLESMPSELPKVQEDIIRTLRDIVEYLRAAIEIKQGVEVT
ncbi:MAG: sugar phosphate isomerase/epimerase [Deltaproteobacteria bacterium]|nr:sugar phosphate isomerase/epimerase [Deltaproteobacteria bacterium]